MWLVIWEGPGRIALDAAGEYTLNMSPEAEGETYLILMTKVDVERRHAAKGLQSSNQMLNYLFLSESESEQRVT